MKKFISMVFILSIILVMALFGSACKPDPVIPDLPITQANEIPTGKALDFKVGLIRNINFSDDTPWLDIFIIKSLSEVKTIHENDYNTNEINYIEKYDEEFFKENALVLLFIRRTSGSIETRIDSLVKNDGELNIAMSSLSPEGQTCDMAYWRIAVEVEKAEIQDITKISYHFTNKALS